MFGLFFFPPLSVIVQNNKRKHHNGIVQIILTDPFEEKNNICDAQIFQNQFNNDDPHGETLEGFLRVVFKGLLRNI